MNLGERKKIVPVGLYEDINADFACDSINMKNFHSATFIVLIHATAAAAAYVKLWSGASDGAKTSALTFRYAYGGAAQGAANCDKLAAELTSANLAIVAAAKDDYMLVIEIDGSEMDTANDEEWLTLEFLDTDGGLTGRVSVVAILEPRNSENRSASALS